MVISGRWGGGGGGRFSKKCHFDICTIYNNTDEGFKHQRSGSSCVNREVGLGCHSLSHSSPVPNKPHGFCRRKAP